MFGGDNQSLTAALAYAKAHGGGAVAVSSQSGAGTQVIDGADVVAIGGFSGNESEVSDRVAGRRGARGQGPLGAHRRRRGGGGFNDGRTGSRSVMAAVENDLHPGRALRWTVTIYDCSGPRRCARGGPDRATGHSRSRLAPAACGCNGVEP